MQLTREVHVSIMECPPVAGRGRKLRDGARLLRGSSWIEKPGNRFADRGRRTARAVADHGEEILH